MPGHGHGPGTTAPVGTNSTGCQLTQYPVSRLYPWSASLTTSGSDHHNFANRGALHFYFNVHLVAHRCTELHALSNTLGGRDMEMTAISKVCPATLWVHRESESDLKKLQSRHRVLCCHFSVFCSLATLLINIWANKEIKTWILFNSIPLIVVNISNTVLRPSFMQLFTRQNFAVTSQNFMFCYRTQPAQVSLNTFQLSSNCNNCCGVKYRVTI